MVKNKNTFFGIVSGVLISLGVLLLLTGLAAKTLISERIGEGSANCLVLLSLVISSVLGCIIPSIIWKSNAAIPVLIAIGNFIIVICCSFILEGPLQTAWETILAILFGAIVAYVICMKKTVKNRKRKRRYR